MLAALEALEAVSNARRSAQLAWGAAAVAITLALCTTGWLLACLHQSHAENDRLRTQIDRQQALIAEARSGSQDPVPAVRLPDSPAYFASIGDNR